MKSFTPTVLMNKPWTVLLFIVATVSATVFTMATALSVADFLQMLFPAAGASTTALKVSTPVEQMITALYAKLISFGPTKALVLYALLLIFLYGAKNICSYVAAVAFARVKVHSLREIRNRVHRAALRQDFKRWTSQAQGQWLSLMSNDMAEYEANVLDSVQLLVQSLLTMLLYIAMLLYLDWRMTLLVVLVMGIGAALLSVSRKLKRQSRQLQSLNGDLMVTTQETIESLKEIKAATAIDYVNERHSNQNTQFTKKRISLYRRIYAASPISDFVGNVIVVSILVIGAGAVLGSESTMSPALFVSYLMIYVLLLSPIKDLSNSIAQFKKGKGVEERIVAALTESDNAYAESAVKVDKSAQIELKGVCFSYGDKRILDHLSLAVPEGCHTAIVGDSGVGKSTLGRLIVGLLEHEDGEILIGGNPTTAAQRRGCIAYIPQEPMLFNDTMEANIRFGREDLTREDIEEAVHIAQLDGVLEQLPEGILANIGEGGSRLSGGERQRVSIARALVGKSDVIVMDEATAALDASTEDNFIRLVRNQLIGKTLLIIAHRASTIAHCDHVFSMATKGFVR